MEPRDFHLIRRGLALAKEGSQSPSFCGLGVGLHLGDTGEEVPRASPASGGLLYVREDDLLFTSRWGDHVSLSRGVRRKPGLVYIGDHSFEGAVDGEGAICIGDHSGGKSSTIGDPIVLGNFSMTECIESNDNIALGHRSLKKTSIIGGNQAIGTSSMGDCGETEYNQAYGRECLYRVRDSYNIAMGVEAGRDASHSIFNHNILLGRKVLRDCKASCIGLIIAGTEAGAKMTGNVFQSVILGDKAASNLRSSVITVNCILQGTSVAGEASNLKDCTFLGTRVGYRLSGHGGVLIGSNAGDDSEGFLDDDVAIGSGAGRFRKYTNSRNLFLGKGSGSGDHTLMCEGGYNVGLGVESLAMTDICSSSVGVGHKAGFMSTSSHLIAHGEEAGAYSSGSMNIFYGRKVGRRCIGNHNILVGDGDDDDYGYEYESIIGIGRNQSRKGIDCVLLGREAGYKGDGWLVRDILMGAGSGSGLKYSVDKNVSREVICIGAGAGQGDHLDPRDIHSCVILGHGAGKSDIQAFSKCLFLGNGAGSFAGKVSDSTIVGPNAGVGMIGERCTYLGFRAGFNGRGKDDIFIGPQCGEGVGEGHHRLMIGNEKGLCFSGDIEKGNVGVGKKSLPKLDGENLLYLQKSETPPPSTGDLKGAIIYNDNKGVYAIWNGQRCCLSYPRREYFTDSFTVEGKGLDEKVTLKVLVLGDKIGSFEETLYLDIKGMTVKKEKEEVSGKLTISETGKVTVSESVSGGVNREEFLLYVEVYGSKGGKGISLK